MESQEIRRLIRDFIRENFLYASSNQDLRDEESFLDRGIIDSTGVLELIEFIEETFGIKVLDQEMVPENLDSVDLLTGFIQDKMGEPEP